METVAWFEGLDADQTIESLAKRRVHVHMEDADDETRLLWNAPRGVLSLELRQHLNSLRTKLIRTMRRRLYLAKLCARLCDLGIGLAIDGDSVTIEDAEGNLTEAIQSTIAKAEPHLARWLRSIPLPDQAKACAPYLEWQEV